MIVVKIGGSLVKSGAVRSWVATLARLGGGRCVVVPGGGAFADTVREAQRCYAFSDRAGHRMALLAMEQCAFMLADLEPALVPCANPAEINDALRRGCIPVWLPSAMALADPSIAESWDVTSDSLAAWLARRITARALILVKSAPAPTELLWTEELAERGFVDRAFPGYVLGAGFKTFWLGPGEEDRLAEVLEADCRMR
jgi:aspartokinase-like uncharacterized kinase